MRARVPQPAKRIAFAGRTGTSLGSSWRRSQAYLANPAAGAPSGQAGAQASRALPRGPEPGRRTFYFSAWKNETPFGAPSPVTVSYPTALAFVFSDPW